MSKEIITAEVNRSHLPEALVNDDYYVLNDRHVQQEMAVREEIAALQSEMEPWEGVFARRYAQGESIRELAKELKKTSRTLSDASNRAPVVRLIHYWQHLAVLQAGPNQLLRKQMLWRLAVDNEKVDPKEATKALAELNRMDDALKTKGLGNIKIIINNASLKRGELDK